jgi:hypothetical protein
MSSRPDQPDAIGRQLALLLRREQGADGRGSTQRVDLQRRRRRLEAEAARLPDPGPAPADADLMARLEQLVQRRDAVYLRRVGAGHVGDGGHDPSRRMRWNAAIDRACGLAEIEAEITAIRRALQRRDA